MSDRSRSDIRKTDFLVIRSQRNDDIVKIVTPQFFQVGLPGDQVGDNSFEKSLVVYGNINAASFIASNTYITGSTSIGAPRVNTQLVKSNFLTGSLTTLADGSAYIRAGANITVVSGSSQGNSIDYITISASGFVNSPLTVGNGLAFGQGTSYDGSVARVLSPTFDSGGGLAVTSANGSRINFDNLNAAQIGTEDLVVFGDNSDSDKPRKASVADLLALGEGAATVNDLNVGNYLQLASGNSKWNGSQEDTILLHNIHSIMEHKPFHSVFRSPMQHTLQNTPEYLLLYTLSHQVQV